MQQLQEGNAISEDRLFGDFFNEGGQSDVTLRQAIHIMWTKCDLHLKHETEEIS